MPTRSQSDGHVFCADLGPDPWNTNEGGEATRAGVRKERDGGAPRAQVVSSRFMDYSDLTITRSYKPERDGPLVKRYGTDSAPKLKTTVDVRSYDDEGNLNNDVISYHGELIIVAGPYYDVNQNGNTPMVRAVFSVESVT